MREHPPCGHKEAKDGCPACCDWHDPAKPWYRAAYQKPSRAPIKRWLSFAEAMPENGPGTELEKLLKALGLKKFKGCQCEGLKYWMNRIGVAGCCAQLERVITLVRESGENIGWLAKIGAGVLALARRMTFIDPADPVRSLVSEAIRRASHADAACGHTV